MCMTTTRYGNEGYTGFDPTTGIGHTAAVNAVAFHPDGFSIASASVRLLAPTPASTCVLPRLRLPARQTIIDLAKLRLGTR